MKISFCSPLIPHSGPARSAGGRRRAEFGRAVFALGAGITLFAGQSTRAANTEYDVVNGQSNLSAAATYTTGGTSGTGAGGTTATVAPGVSSDVTFDSGVAYSPAAFTVGNTALTFGSINDLSSTALTISNSTGTAARVLTLGGTGDNGDSVTGSSSGDLLYVASGATLNFNAGTGNGTLGIALGQSGNFDVVGASTINPIITGGFQLTKTGTGTLTLGGANTYSGGTAVNVGTLVINSSEAGGTFNVASGATLGVNVVGGVGAATLTAATVNITGTGQNGNGALQILGGNVNSGTGLSNSVVLKGAATIDEPTQFTSGSLTAPISDGGSGYALTFKDIGQLTLGGSNTYTGQTLLTGGSTLVITSFNHIASGSIGGGATTTSPLTSSSLGAPTTVANGTIAIMANTTLNYTGAGEVTDRVIDLNGTTNGNALLSQNGTGPLEFTSNFTSSGAGSKTLTLQGASTSYGQIDGAIVNNSATNITSLVKGSAGTWILNSNSSTYSGTTSINNGNLQVLSLNHIASGSINGGATTTTPLASSSIGAPTTAANGTIGFGSTANTGNLVYLGAGEVTDRVVNLAGTTGGATITQSGTGALVFTSAFTATGAGVKTLTLQGSTAGTGAINGAIVDNSATNTTSLTKTGTGTWTLGGANSYTGATTVSAGTLLVNGSTSAGSAVTVTGAAANAATLGGTGTVNGAVTLGSTTAGNVGAIAPGTVGTMGMLTLANNLTFNGGSALQFDLGSNQANSDLLTIGGTLTLGGTGTYTVNFNDLGATTTTYEIIAGGGSGALAANFTATGVTGFFSNDGSGNLDFTVTAVPEPSTWVCGTLLALMLGSRLCRRGARESARMVRPAA